MPTRCGNRSTTFCVAFEPAVMRAGQLRLGRQQKTAECDSINAENELGGDACVSQGEFLRMGQTGN